MVVTNDCEASVGSCTLAVKAGACLSHPVFQGGEFAQEPEQISACSE